MLRASSNKFSIFIIEIVSGITVQWSGLPAVIQLKFSVDHNHMQLLSESSKNAPFLYLNENTMDACLEHTHLITYETITVSWIRTLTCNQIYERHAANAFVRGFEAENKQLLTSHISVSIGDLEGTLIKSRKKLYNNISSST